MEGAKTMQIYYFSRTGRSKKIAEELAHRFETTERKIEDGENWDGAIKYMKAGYLASCGKSLPATYLAPTPDDAILLTFPVWAGTFPPAIRTFLNEVGRQNVIAIPTSLGSTLRDRDGFLKVIDLVGKTISAPEDVSV